MSKRLSRVAKQLAVKALPEQKSSFAWMESAANGVRLIVNVKPNAKKSEVADMSNSELHIRLAARPMDGEANTELLRFLAEVLQIGKSTLSLVKGDKSREKVIMVAGVDGALIHQRLQQSNQIGVASARA